MSTSIVHLNGLTNLPNNTFIVVLPMEYLNAPSAI